VATVLGMTPMPRDCRFRCNLAGLQRLSVGAGGTVTLLEQEFYSSLKMRQHRESFTVREAMGIPLNCFPN
jgi:hypothetical protein